ncbi:MAG: YceI family protein [Porticoccaceae bacterium]|nr:YceI family protein [Porticoccaceae bacterium]
MMKYLVLIAYFFCQLTSADQWQSDHSLSELAYSVNFEQLPIKGQFKDFAVNYSHQQQLRVVVDITSADMGNSDINEAIREFDWFNIKQHSQAIFLSETIEAVSEGAFIARGTLQLKGITKPVSVPFNWQLSDSPELTQHASMSGALTLNRSDFSIGSPEWASGDQIGLDVSVSFKVKMSSTASISNAPE